MSYIKNLNRSLNELIQATEIIEKRLRSAYIEIIQKVGEELNDKESACGLIDALTSADFKPITDWIKSIEYYATKKGGFGDKTTEETVYITVHRFMSIGMEYKISRNFLKKLVAELQK